MANNLPMPVQRAQPARTVPGTVTGPSVYYRYTYGNTYQPGTSRIGSPASPVSPQTGSPSGSRIGRAADFINRNSGTFRSMGNIPKGMPRFLSSRTMLLGCWFASIILVSSNEWNNGFRPPRPARLWYTSFVYFVLFIVGQSDSMLPICNALGIGYTIALAYENISGSSFTLFGISVSGSSGSSGSGSAESTLNAVGQGAKTAAANS